MLTAILTQGNVVTLHDTTFIETVVHDTTVVTQLDTVTLTEYVEVPVHDTTILTDTVTLTETLYITDTLMLTEFDTLLLHDTIFLFDTVIIYDTIFISGEGIDGTEQQTAKVYSNRGQIVVEGADGGDVTLYDILGRTLATKQDEFTPLRFDVPASGTYLIKIGNRPARKVVVIK